jgi:hypothetical protein
MNGRPPQDVSSLFKANLDVLSISRELNSLSMMLYNIIIFSFRRFSLEKLRFAYVNSSAPFQRYVLNLSQKMHFNHTKHVHHTIRIIIY